MKCSKCNGKGHIDGQVCPKCLGSCELDWIENIVGKKPFIWEQKSIIDSLKTLSNQYNIPIITSIQL